MQRRFFVAILIASALLLAPGDARDVTGARGGLPPALSDRDFWQLTAETSEPGGFFRSENLTSNELQFQYVIPDLLRRTQQGQVYLGVGPEQNFTYIASLQPSMAIIIDIRRGNLLLHLMYKALFEMAADRADFVSLLFSRPRPSGLADDSVVTEVFSKFAEVRSSRTAYDRNLKAIDHLLTATHHLPLTQEDLDGIEHIYATFFENGYRVRYSPSYDELMTATDEDGVHRGYLANEASFRTLKDLETRNLVIPVVGDFGGPKAIRRVAAYLKSRGATVGAFYLSNVEQYLGDKSVDFCRNVAALPLDAASTFIRSSSRGASGFGYAYGYGGRGFVSSLGLMTAETADCR